MSQLHCEMQAVWENLFFTIPIIKVKVFGDYIYIIEASTEVKIQVISFSKFLKSRFLKLIRYGNSF